MRKLVIEKSAVKNNLAVIKERAAGAVIYGVLSGDGGGAVSYTHLDVYKRQLYLDSSPGRSLFLTTDRYRRRGTPSGSGNGWR